MIDIVECFNKAGGDIQKDILGYTDYISVYGLYWIDPKVILSYIRNFYIMAEERRRNSQKDYKEMIEDMEKLFNIKTIKVN